MVNQRSGQQKIKALIIDDSAPVRLVLQGILNSDESIEVVGTATDPYDAREKIKALKPDVLTLDVEMPKMDGLTFLENLMRLHPMPVIMISTLTQDKAAVTLKALELGAFDYLPKPAIQSKENLNQYKDVIVEKVKAAATSRIRKSNGISATKAKPVAGSVGQLKSTTVDLIAIGASTGGTEAIKDVLMYLPVELPPIVITQHIPSGFSASYANRLDKMLPFDVIEVPDKELKLESGKVYIAPGDKHFIVKRKGEFYYSRLYDAPPVNRHCPSVDVMFDSVCEEVNRRILGVILTGMGKDGAQGLKKIRDKGNITIVQDEKTSVVWGMPGAAVSLKAAEHVVALPDIPRKIVDCVYGTKK